jgi:redox-sensitive bicupin YhaK (pirin superfamily)
MLTVRRAEDRGHADHGWLDSRHTFSFANYYDPRHTGFGSLRVINDDRVAPGAGFGTHPHRDMEIISYVVEGALEHRDSMGNGSIIQPGEVQRLTAGTGLTHSEYNHSKNDTVRFLQVWIVPERSRLQPGYEQKFFGEERRNGLRLVASRNGTGGSVRVHQDVRLYASLLDAGASVKHRVGAVRQEWLQVVSGELTVNGVTVREGDGIAAADVDQLVIQASRAAHFLLFDLRKH